MSDIGRPGGSGAKILQAKDWNQLGNIVTGFDVGHGTFSNQTDPNLGVNLQTDTFFTQHVAEIETDYQTAVIGKSREEDFYPYVDSLCMEAMYEEIWLTQRGGEWAVEDVDKWSEGITVVFKTKNEQVPVVPADLLNGSIVGYEWVLQPGVEHMDWDGTYLYARLKWSPNADFDQDTLQAGTYTEEYIPDSSSSWGSTFLSSDSGSTLSELLEAAKSNYSSTSGLGVITLDNDTDLEQHTIRIPVARYDWTLDGSSLERCVQLPILIPGGGGSGSIPGNPGIPHPFKSRVHETNFEIEVGYLRPEWKDSIIIENPDTDNDDVIEFDTKETIAVDSGIEYWIYYDIWYDSVTEYWNADLEKTTVWPPTQDTVGTDGTSTGNIVKAIGYASWDSTIQDHIWHQFMYECPTLRPLQPRGDFEGFYVDDGNVRIFKGDVEGFSFGKVTVAEQDFNLYVDTDIWVKITSTPSALDPSIIVTATLQSGTFPGNYVDVGQFNYLIGSIVSKEYIPKHVGKINVDNTLLMPSLDANFCSATNSPRMLFVHDTQVDVVGDNTLDRLLHAEYAEMKVIGGGIQHLEEDIEIEWYGLTDNTYSASGATIVSTSGTDGGSVEAAGNINLTPKECSWEWDHGIVQSFDLDTDDTANAAVIQAGNGITMDYLAGVATINVALEEITVVTDVQLNSSNELQIKTRTCEVYNPGTESVWTLVTGWATTECP